MNVLGIESSCDETAAAVVKDGRKILSNIIDSQEKLHRRFRGIVPEIASRSHVEKINAVIEKAIQKTGRVDAMAVTVGPGLIGSLLVGKMTAEALAWAWDRPLVGINHLEAHLFSALLDSPRLEPPFLGLIVSGGHTHLVIVEDFGKYKTLGQTRDDSAGECFDKVASMLKLGYPGGPAIDKTAKLGNPKAIPFPRPYLTGSWDFSFSGLKTAVLYYLNDFPEKISNVEDICASFQSAVTDVLTHKTFLAAKRYGLKKIAVGGGVSANSELRKKFNIESRKSGIRAYFPSLILSTDNAAMVAAVGFYKHQRGISSNHLQVDPSLPLTNWEKSSLPFSLSPFGERGG
ncbi:MAG: tRNA (adenosine(37)-N6)-threonylcarbamoyltransferase complex transferase subunit TsaD [Elusimicrobia bacterium]|nr:tRNA (adenosine(37)-N6)-threonylcarbamoyltransferase complex transferase subunit TsaD [Elusimicrobiota bacterium]